MYTMDTLPPQRAAVLDFIRQRLAAGRPPSLAEIATQFGFASRNAAQKHVRALTEAGLLEARPHEKRGLRLPGTAAVRPDLLMLPVLGRVAAGVPIGADIGSDELLLLDRALFSDKPDYLLKVKGDSMRDDGIFDGDLVAVKRASEARNGQVVVARIDGEVTIKRLERSKMRIRLLPRNPEHAPIEVRAGQDFAIEGVYCGLVRDA